MSTFSHSASTRVIERLSNLERRYRTGLAIAALLPVLLLLYPFKTIVVPAWSIRVVDESERPIAGIYVTEHWQHYLLEEKGSEELRTTDDHGSVEFSERSIRASLLRRVWSSVGKIAREGFRGRWDCYGSVVIWGSREHATTTAVLQEGEMPPERIVVKRTFS